MKHNHIYYLLLGLAVFLFAVIQSCNSSSGNVLSETKLPEQVSYNFDIRPILSDNCFACHGPDANKREAGLRLDIAEEAYKALAEHPSAHALVPGKPELSEVFSRISTQDSTLLMPPAGSNL